MTKQFKEQAVKFFEQSFDTYYDHTIAVDAEARITWISDPYRRFLGLESSPIGKPISEVIPNSYMPSVIKSGRPVFLDLLNLNGQWVVVSVFPLTNELGEITGAFGFVAVNQMKSIQPLLGKYSTLQAKLRQTEAELKRSRKARYTLSQCIGSSEAIRQVKKQVRQAAGYDLAVLLLGETGTGKELFAHALHSLSYRSDKPFISINVAAVPQSLMEAEFFGVSPGAYTGADRKGRPGKFKLADGGTLFLDEIGDMPLEIQAKLLRVLQEKEVERVGSNELEPIDVRIIAATSKELSTMVKSGAFRADLFYRLNSFPIQLPPLRNRQDDVESLCEKMMEEIALSQNTFQKSVSSEAMQVLKSYPWPGNVRELKNIIEQAYVLSEEPQLSEELIRQLLPRDFVSAKSQPLESDTGTMADSYGEESLADMMIQAERLAIQRALERNRGNKTKTAKQLGISRASLYEKIGRLNVLPV